MYGLCVCVCVCVCVCKSVHLYTTLYRSLPPRQDPRVRCQRVSECQQGSHSGVVLSQMCFRTKVLKEKTEGRGQRERDGGKMSECMKGSREKSSSSSSSSSFLFLPSALPASFGMVRGSGAGKLGRGCTKTNQHTPVLKKIRITKKKT